jgi:hypothetical protein
MVPRPREYFCRWSRLGLIYIDELRHKKKNLGPDAIALRQVARLFVSYTGEATVNISPLRRLRTS